MTEMTDQGDQAEMTDQTDQGEVTTPPKPARKWRAKVKKARRIPKGAVLGWPWGRLR